MYLYPLTIHFAHRETVSEVLHGHTVLVHLGLETGIPVPNITEIISALKVAFDNAVYLSDSDPLTPVLIQAQQRVVSFTGNSPTFYTIGRLIVATLEQLSVLKFIKLEDSEEEVLVPVIRRPEEVKPT
jgi:hypothetical protein